MNPYLITKRDVHEGGGYPTCLKQVMTAAGCTVKELAGWLGVGEDTVSRWRVGTSRPVYKYMERTAQYLNVNIRAIWPDEKDLGEDLEERYESLTERLETLNYRDDYKLFQRLSSQRAAISVKLMCGISRRRVTGSEDAYLMKEQAIPMGMFVKADIF